MNGAPEAIEISRDWAGKYEVVLWDNWNNAPIDKMTVWVVWVNIQFTEIAGDTELDGFCVLGLGYDFKYQVTPSSIIIDPDRPDLDGDKPVEDVVPPVDGINYKGGSLQGGATKKWDGSRQVRQKILYPASWTDPVTNFSPVGEWVYTNHLEYPSTSDGDGMTGGAGAVDASLLPVIGNDDSSVLDSEDNDPYSGGIGFLSGKDIVTRQLNHDYGADGDTVEWRIHFIEFARLDIGGNFYRISIDEPWRVHIKMKKINGTWADNGSWRTRDNADF